jgi:YbbR domain-containing protein
MSLVNSRKFLAMAAENWPAKVLSIVFAIILFVFHRMSTLEDRFFSTPLLIEVNGNLVPASSYPRMIRVSLRGEANNLYPILEDDIEAYIDLTKYTAEGLYRAPVQIRKKGTALGVEPLEISVDPLEVSVELDQKISKYVPLVPSFQGYLTPGYELVSYTLTPNQVVVDGPLRLMSNLSELSTDIIELGGRSEEFSAMVRIMNRDPLLIIRGDGVTEFRGVISKTIIIRNLDNLPVRITGLEDTLTAEAEVTLGSVRLGGNQDELEFYSPPDRFLYLDCGGITAPGTYTLPVQVAVPPGFNLVSTDPVEINLRISLREDGPEDEAEEP